MKRMKNMKIELRKKFPVFFKFFMNFMVNRHKKISAYHNFKEKEKAHGIKNKVEGITAKV